VVIGANYTLVETDRGEPGKLTTPNANFDSYISGLRPRSIRASATSTSGRMATIFSPRALSVTNHELGDAVNAAPGTVINSFDARALEKFGAAEKISAPNTRQKIRFTGRRDMADHPAR